MTATKQRISETAGCVTILAEAFGKTVSPVMFKAYEIGLRGLTVEQVRSATERALETCRFMPAPAELRQMVYLKLEDRAVKAWLAFENAVTTHGYIRTVSFDDPIINATIRALGGWDHCCSMPASEFDTFLQKRFQDNYCALSRSGISDEQGAPLLGWADLENQKNGFSLGRVTVVATGLPHLQPATRIEKQESPRIEHRPK